MSKPINNNTLFNFICEQMEKLDNNKIDVEKAHAQATLAKQANNSLRYELDRSKTLIKLEEHNKTFNSDIRLRNAESNDNF